MERENKIRLRSKWVFGLAAAVVVSLFANINIETFAADAVPKYSGKSIVIVNDDKPYFDDSEKTTTAFENYSDKDSLGRCGTAYANVCKETMPTEERGKIGMVKPSGWHTVKYNEIIDGNYLYNRCHLIGYQLTGENANVKNLITGTRWLNVEGMLLFENAVADYVESTSNHVLYRVTPVYDGNNLVAKGVEMEAWSVEDNGSGICFNVYVYNIQPGIEIDYATGDSSKDSNATSEVAAAKSEQKKLEKNVDEIVSGTADENYTAQSVDKDALQQGNGQNGEKVDPVSATQASDTTAATTTETQAGQSSDSTSATYILNKNTKKYHKTSCKSVSQMKSSNKEESTGTKSELEAQGYSACKNCNL